MAALFSLMKNEKRKTRNGRLSQADRLLIFDAAEKSKSKLIIELVRLSLFIIDMVSQNISQQKDYDVMNVSKAVKSDKAEENRVFYSMHNVFVLCNRQTDHVNAHIVED